MSNEDLFKNYVPVVEEAILKLGVPLDACKTASPYVWSLQRGSIPFWLELKETVSANGNKGILVIGCTFMEVPQDISLKNALFNELMHMNHLASITSFTTFDDMVYLLANRFVTGMGSEEVLEMIMELSIYGDYFDDILKEKYGDYINRGDDGSRM